MNTTQKYSQSWRVLVPFILIMLGIHISTVCYSREHQHRRNFGAFHEFLPRLNAIRADLYVFDTRTKPFVASHFEEKIHIKFINIVFNIDCSQIESIAHHAKLYPEQTHLVVLQESHDRLVRLLEDISQWLPSEYNSTQEYLPPWLSPESWANSYAVQTYAQKIVDHIDITLPMTKK